MSFTLSIKNAPWGSRYWWAEYSLVYSGWLSIDQSWNCPYGAYGATDLHILVVDADYNTLHDRSGLGPVYDGRDYQYDCSTGQLAEEAPPEEFNGTISRMQLEYDGARASIPAYNIPQGQRGLVHIWGRNDMSSAQRMGISWVVYDPDGLVVEEYSTWETWPYTGAGGEHEFIGGRFNLDKPGSYTINLGLFMNPDAPIYVDTYYGSLCTVAAAVPEPEFRGFGVKQYVTV